MRINMILNRLPSGDVQTNVYINDRPILSDTDVTPYQLLLALSQHLRGFEVEPLAFTEEVACLGNAYMEEEYV